MVSSPGMFVLFVVIGLSITVMIAAIRGFGGGPSKTRPGDVWPGVKLGYLRTDGVTYIEDAFDGDGVAGLEAWARHMSVHADVVEAWISRVTEGGVVRVYWVDGERGRIEKASQ
ncbi:hypothetical protein ACWEN6_03045 [Sphaerisporangium sp. NPDC004334]